MDNQHIESEFSALRLRGESVPRDLALLLAHRDELAEQAEIVFDLSPDWAPWLDTSYLGAKDWADPDIRANVKAIADVCKLIDFVVAGDEGDYLGYWRGPDCLPIAQAPIVCLNNEGQFSFAGTRNLAGAILTSLVSFECHQAWFAGLGIESLPSTEYDFIGVDVRPSPDEVHRALYAQYRAVEAAVRGGQGPGDSQEIR